jgi:hypothetical protein
MTHLAAAEHEDEQAAQAWLKLVLTVGYDLGKPEEAVGLLAAAEAAVVRAGSPLGLRVRLLIYTAQLYDAQNRATEGLAKLAEARRLVLASSSKSPGALPEGILADIALEEAEARPSRPTAKPSPSARQRPPARRTWPSRSARWGPRSPRPVGPRRRSGLWTGRSASPARRCHRTTRPGSLR